MIQSSNNHTSSANLFLFLWEHCTRWTGAKTRGGPLLPQDSPNRGQTEHVLETSPPHGRNSSSNPQILFLLLCIPYQKFATKLLQPGLTGVSSDKEFFNLLRTCYRHMRGWWKRLLSLKTIRSIRFVQFEVFKSELVNVQLENVVPAATRTDEYHYRPAPPEVLPPIGQNHMLHLLTHPDCAEDTGILLDRIPKKLRDPLRPCRIKGVGLCWGIQMYEGWHFGIIIILAFTVLLMASLVFIIS